MRSDIIICNCSSVEHQLVISRDESDMYVYCHLTTQRNFLQRLWYGLKYAFGYRSKYGAWEEIMLNKENTQRIVDILSGHKWK